MTLCLSVHILKTGYLNVFLREKNNNIDEEEQNWKMDERKDFLLMTPLDTYLLCLYMEFF